MNNQLPWSEAEIAALIAYRKDNLSAGVCARLLKRSRNSVIGRLHRMGLLRTIEQRRKSTLSLFDRVRAISKNQGLNLGVNTCRWLEGEPKDLNYCGRKTQSGCSWCGKHRKIVFLPRPKKGEK